MIDRHNGLRLILGLAVLAAMATACGDAKKPQATPTPRGIPSPVAFAQEPAEGYRLGDPTLYGDRFGVPTHFAALPGATVDSGRLGGSIYQIEVPEAWNGRLVLYAKPPDGDLRLAAFWLRSYLIRNGFAWGTTSYSSGEAPLGTYAGEMAALWDFFVQRYGRPQYTYITGEQPSSSIARIASIRYSDRFDGALSICGDDPGESLLSDMFAAAAFAAGVTQAEFDTADLAQLVTARIRPALEDPVTRRRYEDVIIGLTGGARPLAREGLRYQEELLVSQALAQAAGIDGGFENADRVYHVGAAAGVSDDEFNRAVVRRRLDERSGDPFEPVDPHAGAPEEMPAGDVEGHDEAPRYDLRVPLLTINTTGNSWFPIANDQALRRNVDLAGKGDLLVQRTVRAPENCGLWYGEWSQGLADLVEWVEHGRKPAGEDLLANDLTDIGREFTVLPRPGSPEADLVPGADQRVTIRGTLTLDGQPLVGGFVNAGVVTDGLFRSCSYGFAFPSASAPGRYELTVAADAETRGCGAAGSRVVLILYSYVLSQRLISQQSLDWPSTAGVVTFDADFSAEHPGPAGIDVPAAQIVGTALFGVVLDARADKMPPGTLVEAYIGDTLCGQYALPVVAMGPVAPSEEAGAYGLNVAGPALRPDCVEGGPISLRVDGKPVPQTAKHTLDPAGIELDLKLEE